MIVVNDRLYILIISLQNMTTTPGIDMNTKDSNTNNFLFSFFIS